MDGETAPVAVFSSRPEAEEIANVLVSNGLSATVSGDDTGGGDAAAEAWGVRVLVAKSDEASAREVLAVADKRPGVAGQCGGD